MASRPSAYQADRHTRRGALLGIRRPASNASSSHVAGAKSERPRIASPYPLDRLANGTPQESDAVAEWPARVPPTGFEPVISCVKGSMARELDLRLGL